VIAVTETANQASYLTQGAYDRLRAELDELSGPGRTEIAKKIEAAREEGDLKENGGYHAAKEEQGKMEARIRQLTQLLRDARVGEPPAAQEGVAGPGMVVTVKFAGGDDETFLIGSREEAAHSDIDVYSAQSPLGQALTGRRPGESVTYTAPTGRDITVDLLDTKPYTG
jgi:transcription elongation factor GreA